MKLLSDFQTWLTALCGVSLVAAVVNGNPIFAYSAVLFGSYFAIRAAWESLKERSLDVNFLMVFAAVGSVALGHPIEAGVLLFLFSLSSTLESYAMARTKNAIEGLIRLRPEKAIRIGASGDESVNVTDLKIGDRVRVLPYETIPIDGTVTEGTSQVDQHAMTGESVPVSCTIGSHVLGGTQNLESMLVMEVKAEVGDTTLEKIVNLVQDAQENKASGEKISAWFGQRYTWFVLAAFGTALLIRFALGQNPATAGYGALTLLVALSPCAVVISTPATTLSALAWAARNGMLIRGGEFIESAGRIDTIALDKTGTLTFGKPILTEICVCTGVPETVGASGRLCIEEDACWAGGPDLSPQAKDLLIAAAAAEQYSTHPLAEAIVLKAREFGLDVPEATDVTSIPGFGVTAKLGGKQITIGQRKFFEQDGKSLDPDFLVHVEELQHKGMTVAVLDFEGKKAVLGLIDQPRAEAPEFLAGLQSLGIKNVLMMTGDTPETARAIGKDLGITDIRAGLLPQDKTAIIEELKSSGRNVMMVGDGINDAPSLASAEVGVAMGAMGSDIALNAADVVLMRDNLNRILSLVQLGKSTNRIIRANLVFATCVIATLTIGSFVFDQFFPNLRNWLLPFAVVGHEGSTVIVILNGLRLLKGP